MTKKREKVGYKKPPKKSQFKKGRSGNPKGRPKKKKMSLEEIIKKVMQEDLDIKINGVKKRMTKQEAMVQALSIKAAQGHLNTVKYLDSYLTHEDKQVKTPQIRLMGDAPQGGNDDENN